MTVLRWTKTLSVGVEALDRQHQHLIALLNRLRDVIHGPDEIAVVGNVLEELVSYVGYHFAEEERLMAEAGYPHFELHRNSHAEIAKTVGDMLRTYQADPSSLAAGELHEYLTDWVILHIGNEDIRYRAWLEKVAAVTA
jgi:hemerythrin